MLTFNRAMVALCHARRFKSWPFSRGGLSRTALSALDAGRTGGRPPKLTDDDIEAAKAMLANPDIGATQIAHRLGVSPATLYRYIPAARTANTFRGCRHAAEGL
jgi:Helix-turn-helix domain of resolvase